MLYVLASQKENGEKQKYDLPGLVVITINISLIFWLTITICKTERIGSKWHKSLFVLQYGKI